MSNPMLITMAGPQGGAIDMSKLSNFEAGILTLGVINQLYPGIKFGQLPALAMGTRGQTMGRKWWEKALATVNPVEQFHNVSGVVGDVKDGIGDVLQDTFSSSGDAGGGLVRLLTDKKVIDGANSSYSSFTDSGGIFGAVGGSGLSDFFGGGDEGDSKAAGMWDFITNLGSNAKGNAQLSGVAGLPGGILPWALGGAVVLTLLFGRRDK